jgi:hypothetical protein
VARTVGEEVFERVEALTAGPSGLGRTEAIRRVAGEMGRTPSSTSSAYYAAARRAAAAAPGDEEGDEADAPGRSSGHSDAGRLYAEMLPLVEAGGSIEQAARRFGSEDDVPAIAAGFRRWLSREQGGIAGRGARRRHEDPESRIVALEAENRGLRNELARARRTLERIRTLADEAAD